MLLVSDIPDNEIHGQARYQGGIDSADAQETFRGVLSAEPGTREDYGEKRWRALEKDGHDLRAHDRDHLQSNLPTETMRLISWGRAQHEKRGNNAKRRSGRDWKRVDPIREQDIGLSDIPSWGGIFRERNPRLSLTF